MGYDYHHHSTKESQLSTGLLLNTCCYPFHLYNANCSCPPSSHYCCWNQLHKSLIFLYLKICSSKMNMLFKVPLILSLYYPQIYYSYSFILISFLKAIFYFFQLSILMSFLSLLFLLYIIIIIIIIINNINININFIIIININYDDDIVIIILIGFWWVDYLQLS
jgi:membrane-associated HD superfamily phosphohydrolase